MSNYLDSLEEPNKVSDIRQSEIFGRFLSDRISDVWYIETKPSSDSNQD